VLVLLLPAFLGLLLMIRVSMGSPVLFRQRRPGLRGRPFTLIKFRTMSEAHDSTGKLLPDGARLTWLGRALRASSADELPEFWNVLIGEMSIVGPRPLLMEYLPLYSTTQMRRHEVRPGITGWAQVHGRNAQSWTQRFDLDRWYVDHLSLGLDLTIIWRTVRRVIARDGISADGHATMPPFTGQPQ